MPVIGDHDIQQAHPMPRSLEHDLTFQAAALVPIESDCDQRTRHLQRRGRYRQAGFVERALERRQPLRLTVGVDEDLLDQTVQIRIRPTAWHQTTVDAQTAETCSLRSRSACGVDDGSEGGCGLGVAAGNDVSVAVQRGRDATMVQAAGDNHDRDASLEHLGGHEMAQVV